MNKKCPICNGKTKEIKGVNPVEYKGVVTGLLMRYTLCESCGSELVTPEQLDLNADIMLNHIAKENPVKD